ncbi:MAG: hypothetical protein ACM31P_08640 [Actinomycetota bacterium]
MTENFLMRGHRWTGTREWVLAERRARRPGTGSLRATLGAILPKRGYGYFTAFQIFIRSCLK